MDEPLVRSDDHLLIVGLFRYRISSAARQKQVATRSAPIASRNYRKQAGIKQSSDEQDTNEGNVRENIDRSVLRAPEFTLQRHSDDGKE